MKSLSIKKWSLEGEANAPYLQAGQAWDMRMGYALHAARQWRRVAYFSLAMATAAVVGLVYFAHLPRAIPHVIEIGPDQAPFYRGPIGRSWDSYRPSEASIRYFLQQFISDIRSVPSDVQLVAQNWHRAYGFVTPQAASLIEALGRQNPPLQRVERERVGVEFKSIIPLSPSKKTWEIDWLETVYSVKGERLGTYTYRATLTTVTQKPTSPEKIEKNPIGLYIDSIHVARIRA